ncbi:MAG: MOSC N-terminal beta barrel domain-containing protein [Planctomycetota bacterium]
MPHVARIIVYPIKSLDGCELTTAHVLPSGALQHDRRWALVDANGSPVNGKRQPLLHRIRALFEADLETVELIDGGGSCQFHLPTEREAASEWFSAVVGTACRLEEDLASGFPDDVDAAGPTIIGSGSLAAVSGWYSKVSQDEMRRRLRANLEIEDCPPFWEDGLVQAGGSSAFTVGPVTFRGRRICQRCVVPSRDSRTGEALSGFAASFVRRRRESLPDWSPREHFDHFYRIAVNTELVSRQNGAAICVGDRVAHDA